MNTIIACPKCSKFKSPSTHTYGAWRNYISDTGVITMKCKSCGNKIKYRIIMGGI